MSKHEKKFNLKKKTDLRSQIITIAVLLVIFVVVEIIKLTGHLSSHINGLLVPLCYYSILAVSLNLVVGILGDLSLGHAGFMCIGAYASSIFSCATANSIPQTWIRFPLALLIGGIFAAIFGALISIPVLRLKGDYLAIVTLAFGEIIKNVIGSIYVAVDANGLHFSLQNITAMNLLEDNRIIINGPLGITGTPNNSSFEIGFVLLLITLIVITNFVHSRAGRAVMSIRDNKIAAECTGINVSKYKLIAFALASFFAGVAGVLYSHNISTLVANSTTFGYNISINILVFVVLGGIGNLPGSIVAACVLTALPELLRGLNDYRMLIYAILLIGMMIFTSSPSMIEFREKHSLKLKIKKKDKPKA